MTADQTGVRVGHERHVVHLNLVNDDGSGGFKETEFVSLRLTPEAAHEAAEKASQINGCGMQDDARKKKKSGAN